MCCIALYSIVFYCWYSLAHTHTYTYTAKLGNMDVAVKEFSTDEVSAGVRERRERERREEK